MASLEEIRQGRLAKLAILQKAGMNPYPIETPRDLELSELKARFDELSGKGDVSVAGRVMAIRGQGAILFVPLFDGTATFQAVLKKDSIDAELFKLFSAAADIGDTIGVTGELFVTQKGERSILAKSWRMLSKSLRPLPEKWNGLQDVEERFRKRYLDTVMSDEVRTRFYIRSKTVTVLRSILDRAGYLEVETPQLQPLAGGTNAAPFLTHHNALDIDLYLRIAPELYLKKLLIGGFPKVYEIGRNFRNEGIDVTHNPEFTMLEFYEAFSTAARQMDFVEAMIKELVAAVLGAPLVPSGDSSISLAEPFARITYRDLVKRDAGIDPVSSPKEEVDAKAAKLGIKVDPADSRERIIDNIYKKVSRPSLLAPTFITDYPVGMLPLAKRSEKDPSVVDAFQLVIGGMELVKAFSELNDPIDQRERFKKEEENAKAGDQEAQPNDEEFIEALEYGMPPAGGVGIGIDRLVMLLTDTKNIKEVIFFPTMRPKKD
ncbi:MAG: lysine--tRNA ligase [Candidatus Taylorbacteria bacterium]|nr:lysine--tRNA ligase [Candidatus Taylorbacteria bacterium]